jgi:hypothetical protein
VVPSCQSRLTFLAAGRVSAAADLPTISPKTRVGVFRRHASGRLSRRGRSRSMFTPGLRACGYKSASGLGKWPNRDPLNERGFELIASKPETSKTTFSDRILIALAFFQQKNPVLFESLKTWLREDPRALQETSQQNANLYAFTADAPISFQDLLGLDSPSSGFTCDKDLLTAAKILCYCPYARSAVVAGICNGCWNGCNKYCLEQYLDGTTDENQMKKCVLDCDKRELKCIRSGCGLKFN